MATTAQLTAPGRQNDLHAGRQAQLSDQLVAVGRPAESDPPVAVQPGILHCLKRACR
jgi:hypothetical protein